MRRNVILDATMSIMVEKQPAELTILLMGERVKMTAGTLKCCFQCKFHSVEGLPNQIQQVRCGVLKKASMLYSQRLTDMGIRI